MSCLVEGTVREAASQLRVSVRLIDPETDNRTWAETFEGSADDVFVIQEKIAAQIAEALELRLTRSDRERLAESTVNDLVAWECIVQARQGFTSLAPGLYRPRR